MGIDRRSSITATIRKQSSRKTTSQSSRLMRSTANKRKRSAKQKKVIQALAKDFLAEKVSAAGISYIVKSRSRLKKWMWFFAVAASISFMGYMTSNVISEYLGYPKMLIREGKIYSRLEFPAVTVCSLNPIMNEFIEETSIASLKKLKNMLRNATNMPTDSEYQEKCYRDPLCQWSWFSETCTCAQSPCTTEFCLAHNTTHCSCSSVFCRPRFRVTCTNGSSALEGNSTLARLTRNCYCSTNSVYKSWAKIPFQNEEDLFNSISDPDVQNSIRLIRNSKTHDLADIEDAMLPTTHDLFEFGMNFDTLVISCSFEGSPCFRRNFTVLFHPKFGKCYMFNYLGSKVPPNEKPIHIYNYGSNSGLQLIMHINKMNAVDLLNHEVGARVVIHDPRDLPFVAEYGINVRPRDMSAIEVTLAEITRLGPPWGSCVPEGTRLFFEEIPFPYSILGCEKECRHRHLTKRCACTGRQYLRGSVLFKMTTKYEFCEIENTTQYDCMTQVIEDIEKRKISCNCKPPCQEMIYKYTSSSSELNERFYRAVKAIRTLDRDTRGRHIITNATNENMMVGVKIYYNTLQVDHDSEVASYSWQTLVANVGGNLGFFMGLTLFTFVEILEFLWDIIMTLLRRRNRFTPAELKQTNRIDSFSSNKSRGINAPSLYHRNDTNEKPVESSHTNLINNFSSNSSRGIYVPPSYSWNDLSQTEK